jgi:tetratricopeptide (TPR) repeat protein
MRVYSTREVKELTGISTSRIRSLVRAGLIEPQRTPRGRLRFSFQDLVLLRTAKELAAAKIGSRRAWRALKTLAEQLPPGRPLSSLRIVLDGDRVLVRERDSAWEPESGQIVLDFSLKQLTEKVAPLVRLAVADAAPVTRSAEEWFEVGLELEQVGANSEAEMAYRQALLAEPEHTNAMVNLGRLRHGERALKEAEVLYRRALGLEPRHSIARYNLGVVLEDQGAYAEAIETYRVASELDPGAPDVHYNLARLYEHQGDRQAAIRHLAAFKALSRENES